MTETDLTPPQSPGPEPTRRPRRGLFLRVLAAFVGTGLVLVLLTGGLFYMRVSNGPIEMPAAVQARVQTVLDEAMTMSAVEIGSIAVALPDGGAPQIALSDVTLSDPNGQLRAAFPDLRANLSASALLQGAVHPTRVEIAGAGVRLSRDAEGRLDLQLTGSDDGIALGLTESLVGLDSMFASPEFAALESVSGRGLNVAMSDAMNGQVMRLSDAQMRLTRAAGALTLSLGGALEGTRDARIDVAMTRQANATATDVAFSFQNLAARDVATVAPALVWLDLVRAPISGRISAQLADDGTIGSFGGVLDVGPGQFFLEGVGAPLRFEQLHADMAYDAESRRLIFNELELNAPELRFAATGHADLSADGATYIGQFRLRDVSADPRGLFEAPVSVEGAAIDLRLTFGENVTFEIGRAVVFDGDVEAHLVGRLQSDPEGVVVRLDAAIDTIAPETVLAYWPPAAIPNTRRWVAENLSAGALNGVNFALRMDADGISRHELQFDFQDAVVRPVRALPPIEGAAGVLRLSGPAFWLRLDEGAMSVPDGGQLSMAGSTMQIPDTGPRGPDTRFDLDVTGALPDVLRLLAMPPINLFADGNLTPDGIGNGDAEVSVGLDLRLIRGLTPDDVAFDVSGRVTDFVSDTLVPGRVLQADTLQVAADNSGVTVEGHARLDGVPLTGQWSRALGPEASPASRVEARAVLDVSDLAQFGVRFPQGMVSGQARADLELDLVPNTPPTLRLRSDLQGMALSVPALMWRLGAGQSGDLRADVRLGANPSVTALSLEAGGLSLSGRVDLAAGGGFERLVADRLRVGRWLDVEARLISTGANRPTQTNILGGVVDLRALPQTGAGAPGGGAGGLLDIQLDRLQVTEGIAFTNVTAEMTTANGLSGQFSGLVNGQASISGTLITTENGPAVRMRSPDGGAVLRAAGVFSSAYGGEMELIIGASGAEGTYEGQLTMSGPRLRDAPAMAELLNLISVVGLLEQLGGEGINLGEVDARFRITPSQIQVLRGAAVGPSMGLSMDGVYQIAARQFDMQGVVSPLYALNGMFGALFSPRREGLFGFSYRLTGTPENNAVTVNPLSILTPGIFREIFRRPPPEPPETTQ